METVRNRDDEKVEANKMRGGRGRIEAERTDARKAKKERQSKTKENEREIKEEEELPNALGLVFQHLFTFFFTPSVRLLSPVSFSTCSL